MSEITLFTQLETKDKEINKKNMCIQCIDTDNSVAIEGKGEWGIGGGGQRRGKWG